MTQEQMIARLKNHFPNDPVEVLDLTGTQDHWEVYVESQRFQGLTRIQQHQEVMKAFSDELKSGEVHALAIKTKIKS